jgi:hypothetical protein
MAGGAWLILFSEVLRNAPSQSSSCSRFSILKFPTDNDSVGDPGQDDELFELQRMIRDNEAALKRAKNMISDLKRHLNKDPKEAKEPARPARRVKKKRASNA